MITINFSHRYKKLNVLDETETAVLLQVFETDFSNLSSSFISYDTDDGLYKLPKKGMCLVLLFQGKKGIFTTVRRSTEEKARYYKCFINAVFQILFK